MLQIYTQILKRELLLAFRQRSDVVSPLLFFVMVVSLFPLAISSDLRLLQIIAPGVIVVTVLLSGLLALPRLFRQDFEDATLEQFLLSAYPLTFLVLSKIFAYWLIVSWPAVLMSLLLGLVLNLSGQGLAILIPALLMGTLILSLLGGIGGALTVGLGHSQLLLPLLILPLYVPVLIFVTTAVSAAESGFSVIGHFAILTAFLLLALMFAPLATASALRITAGE